MGVNWVNFQGEIASIFSRRNSINARVFANLLTNVYCNFMREANDIIYQNKALNGDYDKLNSELIRGFVSAEESKPQGPMIIRGALKNAIMSYWSNANIGIEKMPPGVVVPVSNKVVFPGQLLNFEFPLNNDNPIIAASLFTNAVRNQLITIEGVFTGMVNVSGTLVPTPFPWRGIQ